MSKQGGGLGEVRAVQTEGCKRRLHHGFCAKDFCDAIDHSYRSQESHNREYPNETPVIAVVRRYWSPFSAIRPEVITSEELQGAWLAINIRGFAGLIQVLDCIFGVSYQNAGADLEFPEHEREEGGEKAEQYETNVTGHFATSLTPGVPHP